MLISYKNGQGSVVLRVKLRNSSVSTGAGLTGLTSASSGLIISTIADNEATATAYTQAGSTIETITTLGTFAAPTATKCRFKEVDATNHPGVYEVQIADARFAVSSAKSLLVSLSGATNLAQCDVLVPLRSVDPYDAVRAGLTALPNVASGSAGAIPTTGTGANQIAVDGAGNAKADVNKWLAGTIPAVNVTGVPLVDAKYLLGTVFPTPTVAGVPNVNTKTINDVATTSVTAVNANVGTTQPVNFTGTGASALAKSDVVDIAGAAVSTSTAQIGVNVVNFGGSAGTFASGRPEVNATHIAGTAWASTTLFTLASHDPGATLGTSTLTQTQVTGGAYALNSASFAFNAALDFTTTQKAAALTGVVLPSGGLANVTAWSVAITGNVTGNLSGTVGGVAGTTQTLDALQTALNSTHGAGSWATATGFSTLDAAGVRTAVGLASANLDTQLAAKQATFTSATGVSFPTNFSALSISSAGLVKVQSGVTKNTALAGFTFLMVSSSDHVTGATGLTVTATRSIDGAAFAACANAVSEIGSGAYKIDLAAADLNGTTILLKFTATGADARFIELVPTP